MVKAIGDRFAEALAEYTHQKVRKEHWGYAADEALSNDDLIKEKYRGIRPASGYPATPDHTEKQVIWDLLEAEKNTGATLTENFAMNPGSCVAVYISLTQMLNIRSSVQSPKTKWKTTLSVKT